MQWDEEVRVALYEAEQLDYLEFFLGMDNEPNEILWANSYWAHQSR